MHPSHTDWDQCWIRYFCSNLKNFRFDGADLRQIYFGQAMLVSVSFTCFTLARAWADSRPSEFWQAAGHVLQWLFRSQTSPVSPIFLHVKEITGMIACGGGGFFQLKHECFEGLIRSWPIFISQCWHVQSQLLFPMLKRPKFNSLPPLPHRWLRMTQPRALKPSGGHRRWLYKNLFTNAPSCHWTPHSSTESL